MLLSEKIAKNIVREVNAVIPMKINIMNEKGMIIASSDYTRVNTFHEGAYQIVKEQVSEIRVNYDGEFNGALEGINYPLKIQNYIVGVLGITGEYDAIKESASIIKRMTELILENAYSVEQRLLRENIRNRYLSEWFGGEAKNITKEFVKKGKALGFDIMIPRRIIVCSLYIKDTEESIQSMQVIEEAERKLKQSIVRFDHNNIYYESGSALIGAMTAKKDDEIIEIITSLKSEIESKYPVKLAIGIDSPMSNYTFAKIALSRAMKANRACMRTHKWDIRFYDDLNMEVFCDELDENIKWEYIFKIFKGFTIDEIRDSMILLEVYYDMEGSINKAADKLFIHKNTLQNRLKQIMERTSYDPRSIRHSSLFYIAIYFYRELDNSAIG
ncbi:MAG: CdaR family transcriptional regulator [Anaerocolumna sp.]